MQRNKPTKPLKIDVQKQQLALEALGSESFLSINKKLLSHFGPNLAVYIGNLVDKLKYFSSKGKLGEDNSFFLTMADQTAQTGMSEYQLRGCKNKLKALKILQTQMRGIPPKEFYILNIDVLVQEFLRNIPLVFKGMALKKLKECPPKNFRNIKETEFKETEFKETESKKDFLNGILKYFPQEWKDNLSFCTILQDYIQHRKEKRSPLTPIAIKKMINKLLKYNIEQATQALNESVENGWTGIFPKSDQQSKLNKTTHRGATPIPGKYPDYDYVIGE